MGLSKLATGFAPEIYSLMIFRGFSASFSIAFYQTGFVWGKYMYKYRGIHTSSDRQSAAVIKERTFSPGAPISYVDFALEVAEYCVKSTSRQGMPC
jgi:hypothetical protein